MVYDACRQGRLQLSTSPALLEELSRVLAYSKFEFSEEERAAFLSEIRARARVVEPTMRIDAILDDPDDNRVLECALAAGARCVISGDPDLLSLGEYEGISIITAREAVDEFGLAQESEA